MLEAVGDGIFLLDDEGFIRFWNRAAELVTGRDRASVLDVPAAHVFVGWEGSPRRSRSRQAGRLHAR